MTISNGALAQAVSDLVDAWTNREKEMQDWLEGTALGGPFSDGRYPLTTYLGVVQYVKSPARLQADVDGQVSSALAHKTDAEAARDASVAAQGTAETAKTAAETARTASEGARDLANLYQGNAAAEAANALVHRTAAENAASAAALSETNAATSETNAASSEATASQAAIDAAASATAAATFDPALFLPKAGGTLNGSLTVEGNLTVNGTTSYLNVQQLDIGDNILRLNADLPGTTPPTQDAGLEINRGTEADVSLVWSEAGDEWTANGFSLWHSGNFNPADYLPTSGGAVSGALVGITKLGVGTTSVPHGGLGYAMFALDGPSGSNAGPHFEVSVDADDHPIFQMLNWSNDNISLNFDAYWGSNAWKSSDAGSNAQIYKKSDKLTFGFSSGNPKGASMVWSEALSISLTSGAVAISTDVQDALNFSATSTNSSRGISFNARTALSARHGDGWLRLNNLSEFSNGVYTPGQIRADGGVRLTGSTGIRYPSVGQYGTVEVHGGGKANWEGYSIDGRCVFMHNGSNAWGLYDDINNHWLVYGSGLGGADNHVGLRHNNTERLRTTSAGVSVTGALTATGNVTAFSDRRLKDNIRPLSRALGLIEQLRAVRFNWIDTGKADVGVVAQEVQKVLPELVLPVDGSTLTVDYGRLSAILISAVRELNAKIDELREDRQ